MKKITSEYLTKLQQQIELYFYKGYNLYFIHGWFCAYLSSPSDSEEDLLIPTYLILDEEKITDETKFIKVVDDLMVLYNDLADKTYEQNKLIKPLVNIDEPNNFGVNPMTPQEKTNLLFWLYGYLSGHLVIGVDITEYCKDEALLDEKFFPAVFTLCVGLLLLNKDKDISKTNLFAADVLEDFKEICDDVMSMWEDDGESLEDRLKEYSLSEVTPNIVDALNSIFYVVRKSEEHRLEKK